MKHTTRARAKLRRKMDRQECAESLAAMRPDPIDEQIAEFLRLEQEYATKRGGTSATTGTTARMSTSTSGSVAATTTTAATTGTTIRARLHHLPDAGRCDQHRQVPGHDCEGRVD